MRRPVPLLGGVYGAGLPPPPRAHSAAHASVGRAAASVQPAATPLMWLSFEEAEHAAVAALAAQQEQGSGDAGTVPTSEGGGAFPHAAAATAGASVGTHSRLLPSGGGHSGTSGGPASVVLHPGRLLTFHPAHVRTEEIQIGEWVLRPSEMGLNMATEECVTKFLFRRKQLVCEFSQFLGERRKIEISWDTIVGIEVDLPPSGYATMIIELNRVPLFYEGCQLPRRNTKWSSEPCGDFTDGNASRFRFHVLKFRSSRCLEMPLRKVKTFDERLKTSIVIGIKRRNFSATSHAAMFSALEPSVMELPSMRSDELAAAPAHAQGSALVVEELRRDAGGAGAGSVAGSRCTPYAMVEDVHSKAQLDRPDGLVSRGPGVAPGSAAAAAELPSVAEMTVKDLCDWAALAEKALNENEATEAIFVLRRLSEAVAKNMDELQITKSENKAFLWFNTPYDEENRRFPWVLGRLWMKSVTMKTDLALSEMRELAGLLEELQAPVVDAFGSGAGSSTGIGTGRTDGLAGDAETSVPQSPEEPAVPAVAVAADGGALVDPSMASEDGVRAPPGVVDSEGAAVDEQMEDQLCLAEEYAQWSTAVGSVGYNYSSGLRAPGMALDSTSGAALGPAGRGVDSKLGVFEDNQFLFDPPRPPYQAAIDILRDRMELLLQFEQHAARSASEDGEPATEPTQPSEVDKTALDRILRRDLGRRRLGLHAGGGVSCGGGLRLPDLSRFPRRAYIPIEGFDEFDPKILLVEPVTMLGHHVSCAAYTRRIPSRERFTVRLLVRWLRFAAECAQATDGLRALEILRAITQAISERAAELQLFETQENASQWAGTRFSPRSFSHSVGKIWVSALRCLVNTHALSLREIKGTLDLLRHCNKLFGVCGIPAHEKGFPRPADNSLPFTKAIRLLDDRLLKLAGAPAHAVLSLDGGTLGGPTSLPALSRAQLAGFLSPQHLQIVTALAGPTSPAHHAAVLASVQAHAAAAAAAAEAVGQYPPGALGASGAAIGSLAAALAAAGGEDTHPAPCPIRLISSPQRSPTRSQAMQRETPERADSGAASASGAELEGTDGAGEGSHADHHHGPKSGQADAEGAGGSAAGQVRRSGGVGVERVGGQAVDAYSSQSDDEGVEEGAGEEEEDELEDEEDVDEDEDGVVDGVDIDAGAPGGVRGVGRESKLVDEGRVVDVDEKEEVEEVEVLGEVVDEVDEAGANGDQVVQLAKASQHGVESTSVMTGDGEGRDSSQLEPPRKRRRVIAQEVDAVDSPSTLPTPRATDGRNGTGDLFRRNEETVIRAAAVAAAAGTLPPHGVHYARRTTARRLGHTTAHVTQPQNGATVPSVGDEPADRGVRARVLAHDMSGDGAGGAEEEGTRLLSSSLTVFPPSAVPPGGSQHTQAAGPAGQPRNPTPQPAQSSSLLEHLASCDGCEWCAPARLAAQSRATA